jgi:Tfp pilus assembly protein PilX
MTASRSPRDPQRGNSLLLALIVMSSLATLGTLTVVSVQSSLKASTTDRSQTVAMYAAESGAAAAMEFLRQPGHFDPLLGWSAYLSPNGAQKALTIAELPSNGVLPGLPNNLFSPDMNAYFEVTLINNRSDDHYTQVTPPNENDHDGVLIIHSVGHGPQGSVAVIEWEVQRFAFPVPPGPPWPSPSPLPDQGLHIRSWNTVL